MLCYVNTMIVVTFYRKENKFSSGNCSIMIDDNVCENGLLEPGLAKRYVIVKGRSIYDIDLSIYVLLNKRFLKSSSYSLLQVFLAGRNSCKIGHEGGGYCAVFN